MIAAFESNFHTDLQSTSLNLLKFSLYMMVSLNGLAINPFVLPRLFEDVLLAVWMAKLDGFIITLTHTAVWIRSCMCVSRIYCTLLHMCVYEKLWMPFIVLNLGRRGSHHCFAPPLTHLVGWLNSLVAAHNSAVGEAYFSEACFGEDCSTSSHVPPMSHRLLMLCLWTQWALTLYILKYG